jgi:hypothetical protein
MCQAAEGGDLVGSTLSAASRHVGLLVPFEQVYRSGQIEYRSTTSAQFLEVISHELLWV